MPWLKPLHRGGLWALLLLVLWGAGCASRRNTFHTVFPDPTSVLHIVQPGETLFAIAKHYGLSTERLALANGIGDPSRLKVGQRLTIPTEPAVCEDPDDAPESLAHDSINLEDGPMTFISGVPLDGWRWPVDGGRVGSPFGVRASRSRRIRGFHPGQDINAPMGTAIFAAREGDVISTGRQGRYGLLVVVDHGNGVTSWYAHLSKILVRRGQRVTKGQLIGKCGRTGNATGPHLHFEIRLSGKVLDPMTYVTPPPEPPPPSAPGPESPPAAGPK